MQYRKAAAYEAYLYNQFLLYIIVYYKEGD